jgi:hypothetical protein
MITTRMSMHGTLVCLASAAGLAAAALYPEAPAEQAASGFTCTTDFLPEGALATGAFPCNAMAGC